MLDETFARMSQAALTPLLIVKKKNLGVDAQVLLLQGADLLTIAEAATMAPKEEQ